MYLIWTHYFNSKWTLLLWVPCVVINIGPPLIFQSEFLHTSGPGNISQRTVYGSHSLHEVTMYYPMRTLRNKCYKLIHNLNNAMPFPIDQDFYISPTFQDMLSRTIHHQQLPWIKTLDQYYNRDAWELYNVCLDYKELNNLANRTPYVKMFEKLKMQLHDWQNVTADPWICSPGGVLENCGAYKKQPQCMALDNGL